MCMSLCVFSCASDIPMMFCTKVKQSFSQPTEKRVNTDQLLDSAGFFFFFFSSLRSSSISSLADNSWKNIACITKCHQQEDAL